MYMHSTEKYFERNIGKHSQQFNLWRTSPLRRAAQTIILASHSNDLDGLASSITNQFNLNGSQIFDFDQLFDVDNTFLCSIAK